MLRRGWNAAGVRCLGEPGGVRSVPDISWARDGRAGHRIRSAAHHHADRGPRPAVAAESREDPAPNGDAGACADAPVLPRTAYRLRREHHPIATYPLAEVQAAYREIERGTLAARSSSSAEEL